MFTSVSSQNFFSYSTENLFEHYYTYDQNPNSVEKEPPFLLNFSSPSSYDNHGLPLSHILPQQQPITIHGDVVVDQNESIRNYSINKGKNSSIEIANEALLEPKPCEVIPERRRNLNTPPRKRTVKRDRHSKICTAQGVRDRRMRLSVQIAREFFDLQDMLGFDRASNTVEWLFSKSKKAIKLLSMNSCSAEKSESLVSHESEVVASGMEEDVTLVENPNVKINKKLRNAAHNHHRARECRKQARARARERTREKMMIKRLENIKQWHESNSNNIDQLRSFSHPFETLEESTPHTQTQKCSSHQANVDIIEKYLGTETLTQIAGPMYSYQNNGESSLGIDSNTSSFMGLLGTWDTNSTRIDPSNCAIMNMDSLAGNPTSTCITTSSFPSLLR